jgi:hypothetical protein
MGKPTPKVGIYGIVLENIMLKNGNLTRYLSNMEMWRLRDLSIRIDTLIHKHYTKLYPTHIYNPEWYEFSKSISHLWD